jgi:flagellar biosynthetic protein FlhB
MENFRIDVLSGCTLELAPEQVQNLVGTAGLRALDWLGQFFGLMFAATVAIGLFQSGFQLTPELLTVRWEKLSPAEGYQRLFSLGAVVRAIASLLRMLAVAALMAWVLRGRIVQIAHLGEGNVATAAAEGWGIIMRLSLAVAAAMFLIGLLDYGYQWYKFEQSLKMTRQELKEEMKREEGDPLVRQRIRRLQREAAQRRMMQEVPKATVVVTNPTHLAIALRYDRGQMAAPRVVAVGSGLVAKRIVETARRHGVPILQRPEVARALYRVVRVDREVPAALYQVVAELLAFVYRLRGLA